MPTEPKCRLTHQLLALMPDGKVTSFTVALSNNTDTESKEREINTTITNQRTPFTRILCHMHLETQVLIFCLNHTYTTQSIFSVSSRGSSMSSSFDFPGISSFSRQKVTVSWKTTALTNCTVPFKHLSQGFVEKCKPLGKFIKSSLGYPYWSQINTFHKSKLFNAKMIIRKSIRYIISYYHNIKL